MIINNLHLTLRHLAKQKLNTVLHIVGLTLGISVCLMITLFIIHELSFDTLNRIFCQDKHTTLLRRRVDRKIGVVAHAKLG